MLREEWIGNSASRKQSGSGSAQPPLPLLGRSPGRGGRATVTVGSPAGQSIAVLRSSGPGHCPRRSGEDHVPKQAELLARKSFLGVLCELRTDTKSPPSLNMFSAGVQRLLRSRSSGHSDYKPTSGECSIVSCIKAKQGSLKRRGICACANAQVS